MTIFLYLPIIIFTGNYTNFLILIFNFEKMNFVQYILLVLNKIISNRFLYELFTVYLEKNHINLYTKRYYFINI